MSDNFKIPIPRYELPTYKDDCDMIDICEELGATYNVCYKGAMSLNERCPISQRQSIRQNHEQQAHQHEMQDREDARQARDAEIQLLRDKQAVRRSWVQLVIAAILGGVFAKLIDVLISLFRG